ncbi:hypothetical protein E5K00_10295 [Hymenobacter aquaticus]|uniref:Uncharacterized protein n=1 Tax=Hymenobacter aquaticus TaxID=1867101 RepID=A0A4Z0Q8Z3_9BACT|nr:DUF6364 family protein [Hymenobacter aquaticus]TGE25551.1 hypothetical protein E5K00_10295 [Hymenobacter aquaticus]
MTQLTLNLPDQLAQQAEDYAKAQGKTLAALVEDTLRSLTTKPRLTVEETKPDATVVFLSKQAVTTPALEISPEILALMGSVTLPEGMTADEARDEYLTAKYLQ